MSDVTSTTSTTSSSTATSSTVTNTNSVLDKDDFLTLLLTELQYQDPTSPMDTETILTQTSQLAMLETQTSTNEAMAELAGAFETYSQFNIVSAIGKIASLDTNALELEDSGDANFEVYFPTDVTTGDVTIMDSDGNVVRTYDIDAQEAGVNAITWDGTDASGTRVDSGIYYAEISYVDANSETQTLYPGAYPIESVRFEDGDTYVKLGSSYVSLDYVTEIYQE